MKYWRNLSSVLTGTLISQVLPVLGSFLLARQYAPKDFGIYSIWVGITLFTAICLTGRFEAALPIEEDGEPRHSAVIKILTTIIIFSLIPFSILLFFLAVKIEFLGVLSIKLLLIALPASIVLASIQVWQIWAAAEGSYRNLSLIRIMQAGTIVVAQIIIGTFQATSLGLILGHLLGLLVSVSFCILLMPIRPHIVLTYFKTDLLAFWIKNKKFPLYSLPADAINSAAGQLPILLIAIKFGADIAGFLAMTLRVLSAPIGLIGSSVLDVFKRYAAEAYRNRGECVAEYKHTFNILFTASVITSCGLFFIVKPFFVFAYGESWKASGEIAIWLIPMFALRFIASPLSFMAYIAEKQHFDLLWQVCLLIFTVTSLIMTSTYDVALKIYSLSYAFLYLIYIGMSYKFSLGRINDRHN